MAGHLHYQTYWIFPIELISMKTGNLHRISETPVTLRCGSLLHKRSNYIPPRGAYSRELSCRSCGGVQVLTLEDRYDVACERQAAWVREKKEVVQKSRKENSPRAVSMINESPTGLS